MAPDEMALFLCARGHLMKMDWTRACGWFWNHEDTAYGLDDCIWWPPKDERDDDWTADGRRLPFEAAGGK